MPAGAPFRARLGANESLFGPSPKALAAMRAAADGNWMYADPESHELRAALAQFHGVGLDNIVIGEGIDGLLGLAVKLVVEPGSAVVTSDGTYPTFNFHVAGGGGRLVRVPYRDDKQDFGALLDAARREDARILYVCNPDNPDGLVLGCRCVARAHRRSAVRRAAAARRGLLRYGASGRAAAGRRRQRAGACVCAPSPRPMASPAPASAIASVKRASSAPSRRSAITTASTASDRSARSPRSRIRNISPKRWVASCGSRDIIGAIARANDLTPLPSAANFVTIDCGRDGDFAKRVLDGLLAHDVFARMPGVAPLNRCIRVSCGRDEDLAIFADALPLALASRRLSEVRRQPKRGWHSVKPPPPNARQHIRPHSEAP